jgi:hypothetical protein
MAHEEQDMIEVNLNACWTIVFLNMNHENPTPTVWVCENKRVYERSLVRLRAYQHIKIVQSGPSQVEEE